MRGLFIGLAALAAALLAAVAAIAWLVTTESGLHWAAARAQDAAGGKLALEGLRGTLAGEFGAQKLSYADGGLRIEAREVSVRAHLVALLGRRLALAPLRAAALEVELPQEGGQAVAGPPALPLRLRLARVAIHRIEVRRGEARIELRDVKLEHARLGPELALSGSFTWPDERFPTRARVDTSGTLERFEARLAADVAGVAAEARALVTPFRGERLESIELSAGPVDLARFHDAAPHTALSASLKGRAVAGGGLAGSLSLDNGEPGALDAGRLPLARLEARFATDFASLSLERMRMALHGGGSLEGSAELEPGRVRAALAAAQVDLRSLHGRLRRTALHGPLELVLEPARQFARGRLAQEGIGITAEVVRAGAALEVRELRALADGGEIAASGRIGLDEAMAFSAALVLSGVNPAALGDYPLGALNGTLAAEGRLGGERRFDLKWTLPDSTLYEHSFRSQGSARVTGERVTRADAELRLGANRFTARGAFGQAGDELAVALEAPRLGEFTPLSGRLRASGTISGSLDNPRARISAQAEDLVLPGDLRLARVEAKLAGSLEAHEVEFSASAPRLALDLGARLRGGWGKRGWRGEIRSLANAGKYPLELVAPAALGLAPGGVELGRLEARLGEGRLLVRDAAWSPARLASSGEFQGLPAQWLIVAAGLAERLRSTLLLDGEWRLAQAERIQGFARVRRAGGDLAVLADGPIDLDLESAVLEVRFDDGRAVASAEIAARLARLVLQGEVAPALAVSGKAQFAELRVLAAPILEGARLDGRLSAELRATGMLAQPVLHGTLHGEGISFELPPYGLALGDGTLALAIEGDRLRIESFSIRGGAGRFTASGTLPLARGGTASLAWRAEKLELLDRPDMRLTASGEGEASYDGARFALSGGLRVDRGHFEFERERLPQLGDDVVVLGAPELQPPAPKGRPRLPIALGLRLELGEELVVRGYGFDGKVGGGVELTTSKEGELRAHGRLHAVNATFLAYGQRLDVDPGVLIFDGALDNPSLSVTAWRRNQAVEAGVQISGTARAPLVQLVSRPPVSEGERLSWLVLGRAPSDVTQADLGLLQAAAGALLAGDESVPLDRRIARRFGLDELALRGGGEFSDSVVAVGKRISDRVYVSYEQGLGTVASSLIKLDYALGRHWTVRAETGTSSGAGVFYRFSWD